MSRAADERIALNDLAGGGVTPFSYADGSCGIRGVVGATALPSAITLAATFDPGLAEEYGVLLGAELLAAGHNVLLAPALDITRDPRSGRIGENLGEDPLLAGELGGRMGCGIQSRGVLAVAKHFVGNNVERLRTGEGPVGARTDALDVHMDERALHEVYAAPFRRAVQRYGVAGLLGSYNRLNGEYACQSRELMQLPRDEWGFEGVTVPDFLFAVRDAEAALRAGLDIAGLDELAGRTAEMVGAADDELIEGLGEHVRSAATAVGLVPATGVVDDNGLGTAAALALAERVAIEGAVLLRNADALPLPRGARIALVGAEEVRHRIVVGGAASVTLSDDRTPDLISELESAGLRVMSTAGAIANTPLPALIAGPECPISAVVVADGSRRRLDLETAELGADPARPDAAWSAHLTAVLPPSHGPLLVTVEFAGEVELRVDGVVVGQGFREASPMISGPAYVLQAVAGPAAAERTLELDFRTGPAIAVPGTPISPHLVVGAAPLEPLIAKAVAAASAADFAVVLAGRVTGEAMDADDLALPAGQGELVESLVATGVPVIVVTHGSGPIVMPWRERVAAILHVGHAGERFAPALARMLSGGAEPGGRLPLTLPVAEPPVPQFEPDARPLLAYEEGVDIGYRGYERKSVEPAYWFGHGLGYAAIELAETSVDGCAVRATLRAGPERGGKTVVQLYARSGVGETLKLVGFAVARLRAGEELTVTIPVDMVSLATRASGRWLPPPSRVRVHVGFSRGDLRSSVEVDAEHVIPENGS